MSNEILGIILVGMPSMLAIIAGVVTALASRPQTKADATETTADAFSKMASGMTDSVTNLVGEITKLTIINNARQAEIDKMRTDGIVRDKQIADLSAEIVSLTALRDADVKKIQQLSDKVASLETAGKAKDKEIDSLKIRVTSQEALMTQKDDEISRLNGQIAELQNQHQADAEKIRLLEEAKVSTGETLVVELSPNGTDKTLYASTNAPHIIPTPNPSPLHGEGNKATDGGE